MAAYMKQGMFEQVGHALLTVKSTMTPRHAQHAQILSLAQVCAKFLG